MPIVLLLMITGLGIFWVHRSLEAARIVELKGVRLSGLTQLTAKDVINLAGVKKGMDLFDLKLESISTPLLTHPRIRSVQVKKMYPNHLSIQIVERESVLQIYIPDQKLYYLIDEEGVLLPDKSAEPFPDFYIYFDESVRKSVGKVGNVYESSYLGTLLDHRDAIQATGGLGEETISKIRVDSLGFWYFVTEDGIEFRIGDNFENLSKIENMKALLESDVRAKVSYLDLRFQDVIVKTQTKKKN